MQLIAKKYMLLKNWQDFNTCSTQCSGWLQHHNLVLSFSKPHLYVTKIVPIDAIHVYLGFWLQVAFEYIPSSIQLERGYWRVMWDLFHKNRWSSNVALKSFSEYRVERFKHFHVPLN
jgi:hypothetical protein